MRNVPVLLASKNALTFMVQSNNVFIAQHLKIGYLKKCLRHQKFQDEMLIFEVQNFL